MSYRVELSRRAKKAFLALPKRDRRLIGRRLLTLRDDPRPPTAKALAEPLRRHYSLRAGDYRVVYTIDDGERLVKVVGIGSRRDVYDEVERGG